MVRLTRSIDFSASLRLVRGDLSEAENAELFGRRTAQHGHNYRLEVSVRGEPDALTGMVMDLSELKAILEREVMARFDHRDLNRDTPFFEKDPPTSENFVRVIRDLLCEALPPGRLDRLRLSEGADTWVTWQEPGA